MQNYFSASKISLVIFLLIFGAVMCLSCGSFGIISFKLCAVIHILRQFVVCGFKTLGDVKSWLTIKDQDQPTIPVLTTGQPGDVVSLCEMSVLVAYWVWVAVMHMYFRITHNCLCLKIGDGLLGYLVTS